MQFSISAIMLFALLSVAGAGIRWYMQVFMNSDAFPWGTLVVNTLGGAAIGLLFAFRAQLTPTWFMALTVGGLGSLTTFSSFSIETVNLVSSGRYLAAAGNMVANNLLAVGACFLTVSVLSRLN